MAADPKPRSSAVSVGHFGALFRDDLPEVLGVMQPTHPAVYG